MQGKRFYFIGIGGIGMSSIARYLILQGATVSGYDKTPTEITTELIELGAELTFDSSLSAIPTSFLSLDTTVIYTPAIPKDHPQLQYFKTQGHHLRKRAQFLGELTQDLPTIAVAGTHGKTTTTAILTHLFSELDQKFTAFVGGLMNAESSNLASSGLDVVLVEADEFDRSFLQLHPTIACITSIDADHLDIYNTAEEVKFAYEVFSSQVQRSLVVAKGIPITGLTYAIEEPADFSAQNVSLEGFGYRFDLQTPSGFYPQLYFSQLGDHNLSNAIAAFALASQHGLDENQIGKALANFKGVKRRLQKIVENDDHVLMDDYAHHPTEISVVLNSLRAAYPEEEICAIFQPHLYSRTQDFMDEFARILTQFDRVVLLPIYPARELPIEGITSEALVKLMIENPQVKIKTKQQVREEIANYPERVKVVLGAGDIGVEVEYYRNKLLKK